MLTKNKKRKFRLRSFFDFVNRLLARKIKKIAKSDGCFVGGFCGMVEFLFCFFGGRMDAVDIANLPITALPAAGAGVAARLEAMGVCRVFDLLLHLPRDYEDKSRVCPIGELQDGMRCLIAGTVVNTRSHKGLTIDVQDDTGRAQLVFFSVYPSLLARVQVGRRIAAFGEARTGAFGTQMAHPECFDADKMPPPSLLAVYPSVKGIHQNKWRQLVASAFAAMQGALPTLPALPNEALACGVATGDPLLALQAIHKPPVYQSRADQAAVLYALKERKDAWSRRLILEELCAHRLRFALHRQNRQQHKAPRCKKTSPLAKALLGNLPFALTAAQKRAVDEVCADMAAKKPMLRLLQGDVGAGKTLVAALCACRALDSGWQVALMAPTEILAQQHYQNFCHWFAPLGVEVGLLVGKQSGKARKAALEKIASNATPVVVGTHALFQDDVAFAKLGLVIVDEQHRFGVEQRLKLADKALLGAFPHQLNMTATPIPRTLAMSVYGDMDISSIDQLPPGRMPVTTVTIDRARRDEVLERVSINCKQGKQAYWICPLVEESTAQQAQSAQLMYEDIKARLDIRVGLAHGKMKAAEKEEVVRKFKAGQIDLLVATTVVEVGVDVPNASLMIIENAERLGLSQLHQLRGRVGRGNAQSFCALLYQAPLSEASAARLNILRDTNDGFVIAQKDLQLRGAGELFGRKQTGAAGYYIADLLRDNDLLDAADAAARRILDDPSGKAVGQRLGRLWLGESGDFARA